MSGRFLLRTVGSVVFGPPLDFLAVFDEVDQVALWAGISFSLS